MVHSSQDLAIPHWRSTPPPGTQVGSLHQASRFLKAPQSKLRKCCKSLQASWALQNWQKNNSNNLEINQYYENIFKTLNQNKTCVAGFFFFLLFFLLLLLLWLISEFRIIWAIHALSALFYSCVLRAYKYIYICRNMYAEPNSPSDSDFLNTLSGNSCSSNNTKEKLHSQPAETNWVW